MQAIAVLAASRRGTTSQRRRKPRQGYKGILFNPFTYDDWGITVDLSSVCFPESELKQFIFSFTINFDNSL